MDAERRGALATLQDEIPADADNPWWLKGVFCMRARARAAAIAPWNRQVTRQPWRPVVPCRMFVARVCVLLRSLPVLWRRADDAAHRRAASSESGSTLSII